MKKITFPHMGYMYIPASTFFREMGLEVIVPPAISRKTLDLGVKYGPEYACLPLKLNLGNFIEAIELGAETMIMGGGVGPCRFGYYGEVQREILEDLGYDFEIIVLEPGIKEVYERVKKLFGNLSLIKFYKAGRLAWKKIEVLDKIYKLVLKARACEKKEGQVDKLYRKFLNRLDQAMYVETINQTAAEYQRMILEQMGEFKRGVEVKIGIVGEIYLVVEPFTNLEIEKKLGMLGVTVEKEIYLSHWLLNFLHLSHDEKEISKFARPYLRNFVGGHGLDSVGNAVRYARKGFDGVIQLAPFTCMPEIVAQTILSEVNKQEDIYILSLFFDEHTGEAGLQTRLEAFVDLIVRKKTNAVINAREGAGRVGQILSGN